MRTIVTAPQKTERERRKLKKAHNREASARYGARMRGRALIGKGVNESVKRPAKLIKAAKGLER